MTEETCKKQRFKKKTVVQVMFNFMFVFVWLKYMIGPAGEPDTSSCFGDMVSTASI